MKQLLFLFLSIPLFSWSQIEYSYQSQNKWTNYLDLDVGAEHLVCVGSSDACWWPYLSVIAKDSGEIIWEGYDPNPEVGFGTYTNVVVASDGSIWVAGWLVAADDVWVEERAILTQYSPEGTINIHLEELDFAAPTAFSFLHEMPNGNMLWSSGSTIREIDAFGQEVNSWDELDQVRFLSAVGDSVLVWINDYGVHVQSFAGDEIFSHFTVVTPSGLEVMDDAIFWTDGLSMYRYILGEETHEQWNLGYEELARLYQDAGEIYVYELFENNPGNRHGRFQLEQGTIEELEGWTLPGKSLLQVEADNGYLYQLGVEPFEPNTNDRFLFHSFVRRSELLSTPLIAPDIGVTGIEMTIDSFNVYFQDGLFPYATVYWSGFIQVTNFHSTVAVQDFAVSAPADGGFNCAEGRYFQGFEESIEPGASVQVQYNYFFSLPVEVSDEGDVTIQREFCLYTVAPNSRVDAVPTNNTFCETFILVDDEEPIAPADVHIYPNPTRDYVHIDAGSALIEHIQLIDQSGRVIQHTTVGEYGVFYHALGDLPVGSYILIVDTDNGRLRQRLMVY